MTTLQPPFGKYLRAVILESGLVEATQAENPDAGRFEGASPDQIAALEGALNRPLPRAYREFLAELGQSAGGFFPHGTIYQAESILNEQPRARAAYPALPADAFVYAIHLGGAFDYFLLSETDDPAVYHVEASSDSERTARRVGSLSDTLVSQVWQRLESLGTKRNSEPKKD